MRFTRILVPLDGSSLAESALWKALEGADGATICLLRAAEAKALSGTESPGTQIAALQEAREYLRKIVRRLEDKGVTRVETNVWYGPPAAAIVNAACTEKADLIVMATHGRSGLARLVLGSVAEAVLRSANVPVLVVRPDGAPIDVLSGAGPAEGIS